MHNMQAESQQLCAQQAGTVLVAVADKANAGQTGTVTAAVSEALFRLW